MEQSQPGRRGGRDDFLYGEAIIYRVQEDPRKFGDSCICGIPSSWVRALPLTKPNNQLPPLITEIGSGGEYMGVDLLKKELFRQKNAAAAALPR